MVREHTFHFFYNASQKIWETAGLIIPLFVHYNFLLVCYDNNFVVGLFLVFTYRQGFRTNMDLIKLIIII